MTFYCVLIWKKKVKKKKNTTEWSCLPLNQVCVTSIFTWLSYVNSECVTYGAVLSL